MARHFCSSPTYSVAETQIPAAAHPSTSALRLIHCPPPPPRQTDNYAQTPLKRWDVYVDDFLGIVQSKPPTWKRAKRALLHSLDHIFRPLPLDNHQMRQQPASLKTFEKGYSTNTLPPAKLRNEIQGRPGFDPTQSTHNSDENLA